MNTIDSKNKFFELIRKYCSTDKEEVIKGYCNVLEKNTIGESSISVPYHELIDLFTVLQFSYLDFILNLRQRADVLMVYSTISRREYCNKKEKSEKLLNYNTVIKDFLLTKGEQVAGTSDSVILFGVEVNVVDFSHSLLKKLYYILKKRQEAKEEFEYLTDLIAFNSAMEREELPCELILRYKKKDCDVRARSVQFMEMIKNDLNSFLSNRIPYDIKQKCKAYEDLHRESVAMMIRIVANQLAAYGMFSKGNNDKCGIVDKDGDCISLARKQSVFILDLLRKLVPDLTNLRNEVFSDNDDERGKKYDFVKDMLQRKRGVYDEILNEQQPEFIIAENPFQVIMINEI